MIGLVSREEADFAIGPFGLSVSRAEVIDFTLPLSIQYCLILGGRGLPEVDPWGFLFPLAPLVWAAILAVLLLVPAIVAFLSTSGSFRGTKRIDWAGSFFEMIRVLLLQDNWIPGAVWWWRRLVVAGWMLTALVLVKSYAGNLMSVLAVRYIHQPYQSLMDVLEDRSVTMIWQTNTSNVQFFRAAETGIYRAVAEAEKSGRAKFHTISDFYRSIDGLVRKGDHVVIDLEILLMMMIGYDFSYTGRCDFYTSRERFLPLMLSMIGQKSSPLVPALSKRITSLTEAGLYYHWVKSMVPNSTLCSRSPTRITVSTTLSVANLWGMFVVLAGGYVLGFLVLGVEVLAAAALPSARPATPLPGSP